MTTEEIAAALRAARKARGLMITALAERIGISANMISFIEHGRRTPHLPMLIRLADALDLDVLLAPRNCQERVTTGQTSLVRYVTEWLPEDAA